MLLVEAQKDHLPKKLIFMLIMIVRVIIHKWLSYAKFFIRRKLVVLLLLLVLSLLLLWPMLRWTLKDSRAGQSPLLDNTQLLGMNRNLQHYIKNVQILVEPLPSPCAILGTPLVITVASTPSNVNQRQAVRDTWARYQPTVFVLGVSEDTEGKQQLKENYEEARKFRDIIIFNFREHYQNLTLKTALMMTWTLKRCPQARFMFKTDDDVLVNPWTLDKVLWENMSAKLVGYSINPMDPKNDQFNKGSGYKQQVLRDNKVSNYLSGTGYLIKREYIKRILKKAYEVPIVYLEDVYFTSLVANKELGLSLKHDGRLSPYKPWLKLGCMYWGLATVHSVGPQEMMTTWKKIMDLVFSYDDILSVCKYFKWYVNLIHGFVMH